MLGRETFFVGVVDAGCLMIFDACWAQTFIVKGLLDGVWLIFESFSGTSTYSYRLS